MNFAVFNTERFRCIPNGFPFLRAVMRRHALRAGMPITVDPIDGELSYPSKFHRAEGIPDQSSASGNTERTDTFTT